MLCKEKWNHRLQGWEISFSLCGPLASATNLPSGLHETGFAQLQERQTRDDRPIQALEPCRATPTRKSRWVHWFIISNLKGVPAPKPPTATLIPNIGMEPLSLASVVPGLARAFTVAQSGLMERRTKRDRGISFSSSAAFQQAIAEVQWEVRLNLQFSHCLRLNMANRLHAGLILCYDVF
jgi:hypothetical protein